MPTASDVVDHLKANRDEGVARLIEWLKMPSVGTDPAHAEDTRRAGQWAVDYLRELGIDAELRETGTPDNPGSPIVWAEHPGAAGYTGPHVLFYGHYDVQPADPLELWDSPPFEPVIAPAVPGGPGERIVARGACDDKGQVATFLEALRAWKDVTGEIPVSGLKTVAGYMDFGGGGMELEFRAEFDDSDKADAAKKLADEGLGKVKPLMTMMGLPSGFVSSMEVDTSGDSVVFEAEASKDDMVELSKIAEKQGGMGGMPF